MAGRSYTCWECGNVSYSPHESMTHSTGCKLGEITRPVHCQACAGRIDLRDGPTCPTCGALYPINQEDTACE